MSFNFAQGKQRGFIPILVVILIAVVSIGGYLGYQYTNKAPSDNLPDQVACTQEAKLCPDGTSVGRSGPRCEFAACPTPKESTPSADMTNWKTYTNNDYGIMFKYPLNWKNTTQIGTDNSSFFITLIAPVQRSHLGDNINIDVRDNRAALSIDQYIRKIAGNDPYQYKTVGVNGLQAREYLDLPEASYVRRIYIKHESYIYEISIQSDADEYIAIFDRILSTFEFTQ